MKTDRILASRSLRRSISVSLAATYLPVAALISTCRILPSTGDVLKSSSTERSVRTHTHNAQCVTIVRRRRQRRSCRCRRRDNDRALDRPGNEPRVADCPGKLFESPKIALLFFGFTNRILKSWKQCEGIFFTAKAIVGDDLMTIDRLLSVSL